MKKKIISAMTTVLVVGAASTTFAAANPFSDLDPDHWAYQSVMQLYNTYTADGKRVIDGMGDGTFQGKRPITRYEVAQMVAKALARTDISGTDKAALDRLAAEFSEELQSLGVRVAELEKYADKVVWNGKIEYTYTSERTDPDDSGHKNRENSNGYVFRFEPTMEVNDHWKLGARIDAEGDMKDNSSSDFTLVRGFAEGDYDNFNIRIGKQEFYTNESGLIWDTEYSGAQVTFGNKATFTLMAGRVEDDAIAPGDSDTDPSSFQGVNLQYDTERGLYGGAGWYRIDDDDLRTTAYSRHGREDSANIWSVNAGYKFSDKVNLWGAYANNTKADYEDYGWQAEFDYGNYGDNPEKGDWNVFAGYRRYGSNVSFAATTDDVLTGTKGWFVGASYAPMKNIGLIARYFNGDYITGGGDAEKLFGRVEFFF
ncbi:MAG: putative porin [Selenomonadaceae bacterium]|nr:putative porin [Selenomonadaceae bacterium]MBR1858606.1 putative porin [Selenomonadaceae bacterium]